jgi:hypothetical protein
MVQVGIKGSRAMKFQSDIDIDFGDRTKALALIKHIPASQLKDGKLIPHNTGVYVTDIPVDPILGIASLDHRTAEDRGYVKMDFLNVGLYTHITSEAHLVELQERTPDWTRFNNDQNFFDKLMHVNGHWSTLKKMPEPVDSIARLSMFLAIIRPAKRHLIGQTWKTIAESVWEKPEDDSYYFKKSHSVAYANLVVVNMNLISLGQLTN